MERNLKQLMDKTRLSISPYLFNIVLEVLAKAIKQQEGDTIWKRKSQSMDIHRWYDSMHKWPPKLYQRPPTSDKHHQQNGWIQNLLKKKSVALSYMNNKQTDKEIRETTTFSLSTNIIKYLGVTLTKQLKDLYKKNFNSLKKECN